jgi:hypothetical protein
MTTMAYWWFRFVVSLLRGVGPKPRAGLRKAAGESGLCRL